ncbi:MAG: NAD(P)/FAD-dependent oxidoreductase [Chloroflexota bacterium]
MGRIRKVIVIGGGVSGLAAGGLLARKGIDVQLFEAKDKLGGCCANTRLGGYSFNDGAMYLAMPGMLDYVFEQLGLDRVMLLPLHKITKNMTTRLPGGVLVTMGDGLDVSVCNGDVDCTLLQSELQNMMRKWEPVLRLFEEDILRHPLSLVRMLTKGWPYLLQLRGTVASELYRLFSNDAVRAAMSGTMLYAGVPPEKMPVLSLLGLVSMMKTGLFLPDGGMQQIPEALSQAMKRYGGEIHLQSRIERIVVQGDRVHGAEVQGQGLFQADAVISTVSGMATFNWLMRPGDVPFRMRRMVQTAPVSHKGLSVQLGLANPVEAQSHSMNILPMMEEHYKFFQSGQGSSLWLAYSVPTVTMPELADHGGSIIELYAPIPQGLRADAWTEQSRDEAAASAIAILACHHDLDIQVKRVRSPRDFQTEMHLYEGALYGLSPAARIQDQFPHVSCIPGLYLAGQTTYPGFGVGSAAISGILAAEAVLNEA